VNKMKQIIIYKLHMAYRDGMVLENIVPLYSDGLWK